MLGKANLADEAAGVRHVEDINHIGQVDAGGLGHATALTGRKKDGVQDHVVDQLQRMSGAAAAKVEYPACNLVEQSAGAFERLLVAANHERQRPGIGARCAAAHAGVEIGDAACRRAFRKHAGSQRIRCRKVVDYEPFGRTRQNTIVARETRSNFRCPRNDKENNVAGRRHFTGRRDYDPGHFKCPASCGGDVPHRKRYASFVEIARYAAAHITESDNTDLPFSHAAPPPILRQAQALRQAQGDRGKPSVVSLSNHRTLRSESYLATSFTISA